MKKIVSLAVIASLFYLSATYAHFCNNIYKLPDRLIVKPEKPVTSVDKSEEVRVFVKNNYPKAISNVSLTAKSDDEAVQTEVEPAKIEEMKPGDKRDFKVKITVADGAPAKKHKLTIGISADQIGFESMDESPVPKLRQLVENKNNVSTQVLAAEALAKRSDPVGFKFLKDMAAKSNTDMRSRAIRALGRVADKSTVSFLRELVKDNDGYVRGNVFIALALAKAQTMTLQAGLRDTDPFVKTCAAAALTCRGSKNHMKSLKTALQDSDEYVQVAAAWGLASTGDKDGKPNVRLAIFAGESLLNLPDRDTESKAD
jgi:hypothetical protein